MRRAGLAAWLALCFHGPLVVAGFYGHSYDAATHELFADHYQRSWWALWEPRWSGGFDVSSYPPLVHQVLALLGSVIGLDAAFSVVVIATCIALPVVVWGFARLFVATGSAGAAAIVAVFLPALALTADAFGQLPTLVALVISLALLREWSEFVQDGRALRLITATALGGLAFTAHHATPILFLPPALVACLVARLGDADRMARLRRAAIATAAVATAGILSVIPLWQWALTAPHQSPIPHLSRADLLRDLDAQDLFFWAVYGAIPALATIGLWIGRTRRAAALAGLAAVFGVIGLGGTTPVPALLFGGAWQWLTYERFALWAAVALVPLAGVALDALLDRRGSFARATATLAIASLALYAAVDSALPLLGATERRYDVDAIAAFLNEGDRGLWRYQTFGFAESSVDLARRVSATTLDTSYFTARRIPELTESGIGMLDHALWWEPSGLTLRRVLARADEYSIRWAFVRDGAYAPYLADAGFRELSALADGTRLWEKPDVPPLDPRELAVGRPDVRGVLWGALPLALASGTAILYLLRLRGEPARLVRRLRFEHAARDTLAATR